MSKYFSKKREGLVAYVPGEQPRDRRYIKLNTNECPFPPSPFASRMARQEASGLNLYCDPECRALTAVAAEYYGVEKEEMIFTNGSDEVLDFAFLAFSDEETPAVFPDITYGFYPVFAKLHGIPYREIPLTEALRVDPRDYFEAKGTIFLANPNAPTGIALSCAEIESILKENPENVVVIDEAYVDFGGETALPLIKKYKNLLVTRTFSKSRSLAGGRLGMGFACKELIADLKKVKYSVNPYNVNSMTAAAGIGALADEEYFRDAIGKIESNREYVTKALRELSFQVLPSKANFIFAKSGKLGGETLYRELKDRGILVRYFDKDRLREYIRISIGTKEEMDSLLEAVRAIMEEKK